MRRREFLKLFVRVPAAGVAAACLPAAKPSYLLRNAEENRLAHVRDIVWQIENFKDGPVNRSYDIITEDDVGPPMPPMSEEMRREITDKWTRVVEERWVQPKNPRFRRVPVRWHGETT